MRLGYIIIYVEDVTQTLAFYEKAFDIKRRFVAESGLYAELETGSTVLAFTAESFARDNGFEARSNRISDMPAGVEIAFVSDDVSLAYHKAIDAGAVGYKDPKKMPWGQTVACVRDLNGCLVEICSPIQVQ